MIPLFSSEQVRNADKYAIERLKIPSISLMENASLSLFFAVKEHFPQAMKIGIVCGKGNNGGDGFALARHLLNDGFSVRVIIVGKQSDIKGDALVNFTILKNLIKEYPNSKIKIYKTDKELVELKNCDLIIDALLGTGTKGELKPPYKSIINYLNKINSKKLAIDLPSGLNLDNSTGNEVFNANLTVTLADLKSGLFYGDGYKNTGKVIKGSIGIGPSYFIKEPVMEYLIEPEDALRGLPIKNKSLHKYSNGKVLVIAGSGKYPGAAALTASSAMKSGSGSVILAFPENVKWLIHPKLDEVVLIPYSSLDKDYLNENSVLELKNHIDWADIVVIGPGLGRANETVNAVNSILKYGVKKRFVIDADAIFALGKFGINGLSLANKVLTPHHAEFANLLGISLHELENDLLNYGRKFVKKHGCILVLKGAPTIIFGKNGDALINTTGNVGMAKFGTGDILSGIIAGFSALSQNFEESIISGVYMHSLSADLLLPEFTEFGITPTLIMENLHNAINFLRRTFI